MHLKCVGTKWDLYIIPTVLKRENFANFCDLLIIYNNITIIIIIILLANRREELSDF